MIVVRVDYRRPADQLWRTLRPRFDISYRVLLVEARFPEGLAIVLK